MPHEKLQPFHKSVVHLIEYASKEEIVSAWMYRCIGFRFDNTRTLKIARLVLEQSSAETQKQKEP